jgi:hypothetical protein
MHNRIQKYVVLSILSCGQVWAHQESSILKLDHQMQDIVISSKACPCDECCMQREQAQKKKLTVRSNKKYIKTGKGKKWTILVFMAADNGLRRFAVRNIQEMAKFGSNEHFNLLVHLDILKGSEKISEFYYIEKNNVYQIDVYPNSLLPMDSGNPQTLLEFCKHGISGFPAEHNALILWNHGTGTINPRNGRFINPSLLFSFNPLTNKLDLDRSVAYLDLVSEGMENVRGVCWDDTTGNYLSNEILAETLQTVCNRYLNGKAFDIIGFDACLMQMIEVCSLLKKSGNIIIGSQEVELGTGWNYALMLMKFMRSAPTPEEFARHIVASYQHAYQNITNDYTLSAIRMSALEQLEKHVDQIATYLYEALQNQSIASLVNTIIAKSRDPRLCTHYDEPSYVDLYHFYSNLGKNLRVNQQALPTTWYTKIKELLSQKKVLFKNLVFAQTAGRNLAQSHGVSIYFPFHRIHASYQANDFFKTNAWGNFLTNYVRT